MKKLLALFFLTLMCVGGWAQTQVTALNTSKYYTLACSSTEHDATKVCLADVNGTIMGRSTTNTFFQFEAGESDGQYYIKSVASNKYIVASGTTDGSTVSLSDTKDTYWTVAITGTALYIRPNESTNTYLNNNMSDSPNLKIASGNGDCSKWKVCEYSLPISSAKGYKLKLKGHDLYVNFAISGYTETNAVNATKLTNEANASVFSFSSVADTENGFNLKWRNEYMKTAGTWSWNSGHGTTADTWYIVPVEIDSETYYNIKKNTEDSGDIFFGTNQTVADGTYLYTNVNGGDINWEIVECDYDAMMVNQGYWPETSTSAALKYYSIRNTRNGNYFAQYVADNKNMALVSQDKFDASCYFYFIDVQEDNLPYDVKAVKIANAATTKYCAGVNSYNVDGITWYIKKGVYNNSETVAIDKQTSFGQGWNNQSNANTTIAQWSSNDVGSTWEIKALEDQPHAIAPTMSTADNKILYNIVNFRRNKYADSQEEGGQIKEVEARGIGSFWYFEDASADNTAGLNPGVLPVYMVNALNGKYLKSHSTGSNSGNAEYVDSKTDAQIWYLSPYTKTNGTNNYIGYGIGKTTQIAGGANGQVAWNDNGGNYVCQYGVDDAGSIWKFVPATNADVNTAINNAKAAWSKEVALNTFADYYAYDKTNVAAFGTAVDAVSTSGNNISNLQTAYPVLAARATMLAGGKIGTPVAGDVIRLKNFSNSKYMNQADDATTLSVVDAESNNNLWILAGDAENGFSLQNKASKKYLKGAGQSANFSLSDDPVMFDITNIENCFAVLRQHDMTENYEYAHYGAGTNTIVGWETSADATRWSIACVESENLLNEAKEALKKMGIGYPTTDCVERSTLQSAINDGSASLIREALLAYKLCSTIKMPEDGKAYALINIATNGLKHNLFEENINEPAHKLTWGYFGEGSVSSLDNKSIYICRVNGDYYTFVNAATGNYLVWRGSDAGFNDAKGYSEEYVDDYCRFAIHRPTYNQSTMGNISSQADLFGWLCIEGKRDGYNGIDKCFLYSTSGTDNFNQDTGNTERYGDGHSSMFEIKEAYFPYNTVNLLYDKDATEGPTYASVYLPFNMTVPAGVKAYAVTGTNKQKMVLSRVADGESATDIAKGAYILYSETTNGSKTILPAISNNISKESSNRLEGSVSSNAQLPTAGTTWVLGKKSGIGFYKYTGTTYPLGKALFVDYGTNSIKFEFSFADDDLTAIKEAIEEADAKTELRDLWGNKVVNPVKGQIYILNGKTIKY